MEGFFHGGMGEREFYMEKELDFPALFEKQLIS